MSAHRRLSPREAAALIGCSVRHLRRLPIRRIPLPSVGTGKRPRIQYLLSDVEAYLGSLESPRSRRRPAYATKGAAA